MSLEDALRMELEEVAEKFKRRQLPHLSDEEGKKVLLLVANELRRRPHDVKCPACGFEFRFIDIIERIAKETVPEWG